MRKTAQHSGTISRLISVWPAIFLFFFISQPLFANHQQCNDNTNAFSPAVIQYDSDINSSYCELCGIGEIRMLITNPSTGDMSNFTITHDFLASGLEYVPGSTTYRVNGGGLQGGGNPNINGTQLNWDSNEIGALAEIRGSNNHSFRDIEIRFQIRSPSGNEEDLVNATRNVQAQANYTFCAGTPFISTPTNTDAMLLAIREPQPSVSKFGRNVDAAQGGYSSTVYGNINDDILWRIRINNNGLADLQDLRFDDLMQNGNFQINYACPNSGDALNIANNDGVAPGGSNCVAASNNINDFIVDDPFGNPSGDESTTFIDVPAGGNTDIYLVGKITNSCNTNTTNTVDDIQWGCEVNGPDGGISNTSNNDSGGNATATLSSLVVNNGLLINRNISGSNLAQPAGSKATITITITNNTGGSVKDIYLRDILPTEYVVDSTFVPTLTVTPRYGNYPGLIDTVNWTNPVANTFPLVSANPADPLANTEPEFSLTSTTTHPDYATQVNMMRHGDVAVLRFRAVLIPQTGYAPYDLAANLDVRTEIVGDATDPASNTALSNQLYVTFEQFCNLGVTQQASSFPYVDNVNSDPEDLDIDIGGTELIFILTNNTNLPLPLQVNLTNNGGHDATNYYTYVTFGATMDVVTAPATCSVTTNPPTLEVWEDPAPLPATATIYECLSSNMGTVTPGQTRSLNFEVIKSTNASDLAEDDLSFRADVVGEITLSDGTPLWFPTPDTTVINNRANNYSLDAVRARVIGFNLAKTQIGNCTENNPPPASPDNLVQIGEECSYNIHTGGWFGFQTPGFTYIAVQAITVTDQLPDGQGYVSSTDPYLTSDASIKSITLTAQTNPPLQTLDEGWIDWSFNQDIVNERITVRDQWFDVNLSTRLLNDPIDTRASPNIHAARSRNVLNSVFQAVFFNNILNAEETFDLDQNTLGYPQEVVRRVDLTVTEPNITVVKEACNETLYGIGTTCSNFVNNANDGDTQDSYIYRITLTNQNSSSGTQRAPAYNLTSTDILDVSDLVYINLFNTDGLDNDADGLIDAADINGEGSIDDNVVENGTRPTITYSYTHSDALLRIDPGASVTFYYRIDPDDSVAPLQQLDNSVTVTYDTLEGDSGNQTIIQSNNSEIGGARVYTSTPAQATVQILPLVTQAKTIINTSHTTISAVPPQPVTIGEELEYELRASIPVANLRDFYIRDELPAGISCSEAPLIDLDVAPYSDAGFMPGGQFTPTCTDNLVQWNFGNQELTKAPDATARFDFYVRFIARVDNSAITNDGATLSNGSPATNTILHYIDETNADITLNFAQHDSLVREPNIVLSKTFEVNTSDAGDIVTVNVTANNTGTAPAYNLQILEFIGPNLTFINAVSGTDPPDNTDVVSFGVNQPLFSWNAINPSYAIAVGASISFTFEVAVDIGAQPWEILDNTIQASWTSLPSQSTALNSTTLIGIDGSSTGLRNGTLPNSSDVINDYETNATDNMTVPAITMSKTDLDPTLNPEIGAHKHFQIEILLPEGTSYNVTATDNLNFSSIASYVLTRNTDFDVSYTFDGIANINGLATSESAFNASPIDNASGNIIWDIGTVVTQSEDDTIGVPTIQPRILIDYYARINNDLSTDVGDILQNSVQLNYTNGETAGTETLIDTTAAITVIEPLLTVTKVVAPITPAPLTGGDILEYRVTITNSGNATAYDINIVDTLPVQLALYNGFTPSATINAVIAPNFVALPTGLPNGPLIWGRNNNDTSLDIPAGEILLLTYQVMVQAVAEANVNFANSVYVDWTSLDNISSYERHANTCPSVTAPNDYCSGPASVTSTIDDSSTLVKSLIDDGYSDAFSTATDGIVRIGDVLTFRLELNLQEGYTRNVIVEDIIPAGMELVDILSINGDSIPNYVSPITGAGSNFIYAPLTSARFPGNGQSGTLRFNFGNVTNNPLGDTSTDSLIIEYRAQVLTNFFPHVPSININNTATMSYIDYAGTPVIDSARLQSIVPLTIWQPEITTISKIDRAGRPSIATVNVALDIMNFRIEACNTTGLAPAYSVSITDTLPSQLNEASIRGPVNGLLQPDVYISGVLGVPNVDYQYTPPAARGGNMTLLLITPIDATQCVQLDYDIGFYTDFSGNQTWSNNATLNQYWSLPLATGQNYGPVGPAIYSMTNGVVVFDPPNKVVVAPVSGEATIGEEILYSITVPATVANAALYDVNIYDFLPNTLEFVSAVDISGNGFIVTDNSITPDNVSLAISNIPAGQQAIIQLRTRIRNNATTNAGIIITNTASYTFAGISGGPTIAGGSSTSGPVRIVEPNISLIKSVSNVTAPGMAPTAGNLLRYSLSFSASGGIANDNFAGAFDLIIDDSLSLGQVYQAGSVTVDGVGNTIADPVILGDGISTTQSFSWNLSNGNADIDIVEGATVTVTYDVLVLDWVVAEQVLSNTAIAQWSGIDDANLYERTGNGVPIENDYITLPISSNLVVPNNNSIVKTRLNDTYGAIDANVRIGDILEYELRITLQEGSHPNLSIVDTLPQGLQFEDIIHINGNNVSPYPATLPFVHNDITTVLAGDASRSISTLTWNIGDLVNPSDNNATNNDFVIAYRARVLNNVLNQIATTPLINNVNIAYDGANGVLNKASNNTAILQQPVLSVLKTAITANGDSILDADELVSYTVDIINSGAAPAYDLSLMDTLPIGLRYGTATLTMLSTTLVNAATNLTNIPPNYDPLTGVALWNFDNGVADAYTIPAGETLRIVYQVQADADLAPGRLLANQAVASVYYSFDDEDPPILGGINGVAEIYGPSNISTVTLSTAPPIALDKQNTVNEVAIGDTFSYRIIVPSVIQTTALHDIRILDDLSISAADLAYVSVNKISGSQVWSPENTGTASNLIIEDTVNGIDIPAGEQIEIELVLRVIDSAKNIGGLAFNNTATYTFNQTNNDAATQLPGVADTTANISIISPDVTVLKTGPPQMRVGLPGTFTLNIHNTGNATAWDMTITDLIPNPVPGGMCDLAPYNFVAQIYLADGVTPVGVPLIENTDFAVNFVPATPTCTLSLTMMTTAASLPPDHRLIINYDTQLDVDTVHNVVLTNIAGVSQWYSADTAGAGATGDTRTYSRTLTDGSITVLDFQDAHNVLTEPPNISLYKSVVNITTGEDPALTATPGDVLRYRIVATNASPVEVFNFSIVDELDRLNASAMFAAGSINIITTPTESDVSNTNIAGGAKASGMLDIRNLALAPQGNINDSITVEFEATLAPVITNATVVLNQAQLLITNVNPFNSDDPNINGMDDPLLIGDEDPTPVTITSWPLFQIYKTSTDLSGSATELLANETLRYTITVKNIGTESAINASLMDQIPANTTYVANSTTLNGIAIADPIINVSALESGLTINTPLDTTPGSMPANTDVNATNVATITFDVVINADVVNASIISNQAYFNADGIGSGSITEQVSDDPDTIIPNDPTRDVVGNFPLVDALKTVTLLVDNGNIGIVDPGDYLRYTITVTNYGAVPATGVVLVDTLPANTLYITDSVFLNGIAVAQPDAGISPLTTGIPISSADQTPPLPSTGAGYLSAAQSAVITFDVQVDPTTPIGTVISNQGYVDSNEQLRELTDADGIDANGDQPTLSVVGVAQQLSITKQVLVVGGGAATAGGQLEYIVTATNIGLVPASYVVITDNLSLPVAGQMTLVNGSATLNGLPVGITYTAPLLTADYFTNYGNLPPGQSATLRFLVQLEPTLAIGTTITNNAQVSWNLPPQTAMASVSIDIGGTPGVANLNGSIWHDMNYDDVLDNTERRLEGWSVAIFFKGKLLDIVATDSNGEYHINGLAPNYLVPDRYELHFLAPGNGINTGKLGLANSDFIDGLQYIGGIILYAGNNLQNLNLPIDPNGVVYNSIERTPIAGATVTLLRATDNSLLPADCFDDPLQQGQVTLADGFYKFDINFSQLECLNGDDYVIQVTGPVDDYVSGSSIAIPPTTSITTAPFSVPNCLSATDDAIPATVNHCEIQTFVDAPAASIAARSTGTDYYLHLTLNNGIVPGESQLFNNHIPVDPIMNQAVTISKVTPLINVTRGELIPYKIEINNRLIVPLTDITIFDNFPAGFKYIKGSARVNKVAMEPTVNGLQLSWNVANIAVDSQYIIELLLIVGGGVEEGEYVNRAHVFSNLTNSNASIEANATVNVVPDPTFDCSDIVGKVFDDKNLNGTQEEKEPGIAGVRLVTATGLLVNSDQYGRFHITCAVAANENRGSNFIIKLDDRSLPSGYRIVSENPRVQRMTRGKLNSFNFAASIHRIVTIDVADGVFEESAEDIRQQWLPRLGLLIEELREAPSILRLTYLADTENKSLVEDRLKELRKQLIDLWKPVSRYPLFIETEVFWRHGAPIKNEGFD